MVTATVMSGPEDLPPEAAGPQTAPKKSWLHSLKCRRSVQSYDDPEPAARFMGTAA